MSSHSLGNGYVEGCFLLYTIRKNAITPLNAYKQQISPLRMTNNVMLPVEMTKWVWTAQRRTRKCRCFVVVS